MKTRLEKEVRFLKVYAFFATLACGKRLSSWLDVDCEVHDPVLDRAALPPETCRLKHLEHAPVVDQRVSCEPGDPVRGCIAREVLQQDFPYPVRRSIPEKVSLYYAGFNRASTNRRVHGASEVSEYRIAGIQKSLQILAPSKVKGGALNCLQKPATLLSAPILRCLVPPPTFNCCQMLSSTHSRYQDCD